MYKSMYKYELARAAGVSMRTFRNWLSQPAVRTMLTNLGVSPSTRILPPHAVKALCDHFAILVE